MDELEQPRDVKFDSKDALAGMPEEAKESPIGAMIGVAAIALNMAMKYHDISTIQDGTLYQQYKLEGRNMVPLHLDMVFHTAMQIEVHLINANRRVALLMMVAVIDEVDNENKSAPPSESGDPQTLLDTL